MTAKIIVAVAGASGELGLLVIESILSRNKNITIRALVRRSTKDLEALEAKYGKSIEITVVDYSSLKGLEIAVDGVYTLVSTLQGLENVIIQVQLNLVKACLARNVKRFIPSVFSYNYSTFPKGLNRNTDLRKDFEEQAQTLIKTSEKKIEFVSIFNGMFTDLLTSPSFPICDYNKRQLNYYGSPDLVWDFTTYKNTAEYTGMVAIDQSDINTEKLIIAGDLTTWRKVRSLVSEATGEEFTMSQAISHTFLRFLIPIVKVLAPGKKGEVMPPWQGMQYGLAMTSGLASSTPEILDNDRYAGIEWTPVQNVIKQEFVKRKKEGKLLDRAVEKTNSNTFVVSAGVVAVVVAAYLWVRPKKL